MEKVETKEMVIDKGGNTKEDKYIVIKIEMEEVEMYNTNGFKIETMYDYYITMKSMFLVVKLFSHSSIGYASLTIFLP